MRKTPTDIEGLGRIVELHGDFSAQLQELRDAEAELISPRDEAYTRIKTAGNIGKSYGTRTPAGFECAKGQLPLMRGD